MSFAKQALRIYEGIESPNAQKMREYIKKWGGGERVEVSGAKYHVPGLLVKISNMAQGS
jgi:hypothetical protein